MKQTRLWRDAGLLTLAVVFAGGCAANKLAPRAVEEPAIISQNEQPQLDTSRASDPVKPAPMASEDAAGIVVHIDPTTREFLPEPPAAAVAQPPAADAAKAPLPELYEVASPTPGGGVMIDLKGHFRTPLVATIDADGKVTLKHESGVPAGAEKK
jgi:hypothetical protein